MTKLAENRAEQLKRDTDKMMAELNIRLRQNLQQKGDFSRIHPMPQSGQDVPDDLDARLVVLDGERPYSKEPDSPAEMTARSILESRGNMPRLYRNTLMSLAADKTRFQDLDEAIRKYLAWESVLSEKILLDLAPQQVKQAEEMIAHLTGLVGATVTVTLEVTADIPSGIPKHVVRTVSENGRTLKFTTQGFEKD